MKKTLPAISVPADVPAEYARTIRLVLREINRDIKAAADTHYSAKPTARDAAAMIAALTAIREKYEPRFKRIAKGLAARIIDKIIKSVDYQVLPGIRKARAERHGNGTINPANITPSPQKLPEETAVKAIAFSAANISLITSILTE